MSQQVTSGLLFYPRGGSAQVVRYLRRELRARGWAVPLVVGSLGPRGAQTNASTFFGDDQLSVMDYTAAVRDFTRCADPIAAAAPLHPSYEDRTGVPDRIFTAVSPALADHLTTSWRVLLEESDLGETDIFHLHHLTPQYAAVAQLWPDTPIIGHLHGTELKMIEHIIARREVARLLGFDLANTAGIESQENSRAAIRMSPEQREIFRTTNWQQWRYGDFWEARLREYARHCCRLVVISPHDRDLVGALLGIGIEHIEWVPNGVDTLVFARRTMSTSAKLALLRHWLVEDPQGWDESGVPGSIRYADEDLRSFVDRDTGEMQPVLLYVGRYLDFKRVPLLIRAYQRARPLFDRPAPLLIWGGSPGEWEGMHPHTAANAGNPNGIFFVGWRGHEDLPYGLNCVDIMVAPSHSEPFGQVYLEAMAAGVPVIASRSGGPLSFVNVDPHHPNGWLFPPDDLDALTATLVEVVNNPDARRERGEDAYTQIRRDFSWTALAGRFEEVYRRELDAQK